MLKNFLLKNTDPLVKIHTLQNREKVQKSERQETKKMRPADVGNPSISYPLPPNGPGVSLQ